jgi:alanyl-tRNA synthetase
MLEDELDAQKARQAAGEASRLAAAAVDGTVVARLDGLTPDDLRRLAVATRDALGRGVVALAGLGPDGTKAGLAVAVSADLVRGGASAAQVAAEAARALGGGTAKNADVVVGGGPKTDGLDAALALVGQAAREAVS